MLMHMTLKSTSRVTLAAIGNEPDHVARQPGVPCDTVGLQSFTGRMES